MFDPAALGNLIIGLDRAHREFEPDPEPRRLASPAGSARPLRPRAAFADALRALAARIDRGTAVTDASAA